MADIAYLSVFKNHRVGFRSWVGDASVDGRDNNRVIIIPKLVLAKYVITQRRGEIVRLYYSDFHVHQRTFGKFAIIFVILVMYD